MARIVRAGEASSEAERRNEGSTKCVRNPEKPDFCEAKSHPKNENSKLDICPIKKLFRLICFWKQFLMKKLAVMAENLFLLQFIMPGFTKVNLSAKLSGKFLDDEILALTMFSK